MKLAITAAAFAALLARPALAEDAKASARAALSEGAGIPTTPPSLPDRASATAKAAFQKTAAGKLKDTAFDKKGAAERAAHGVASQQGTDQDVEGRTGVAARTAQGAAASAARSANADSHAAAGQARAAAAGGIPSGVPAPVSTGGRP